MIYISRIELTNIRCFEHIEIDLSSDNGIRNWGLFLGDNGVGKTTVLRCIALGLGDRESTAALFRDSSGEWVRRQSPKKEGKIRIEFFKKPKEKTPIYTELTIRNENGRESIIEHEQVPEKFPWNNILVCSYGAARGVFGSLSYEKYRTIDSVYTLFGYDTPLQNPELTLRRIESTGIDLKDILESIDSILMLPKGSTVLKPSGIYISGPWGKFMPLDSVGDGYRATLAWVVDFIGWAMFYHKYSKIVNQESLAGIILIDEIEQHLHPIWQRRIISLLYEQFKNTQFIGTTHSPLCASGMADLPDQISRLELLELFEDEPIVRAMPLPPLRGLRADQVLTSKAFGLPESRNFETQKKLERLRELILKEKPSPKEKTELKDLRNIIEKEVPELAEKEEDRKLEQNLKKWLNQILNSRKHLSED